jgi:hypothetical protein
VENRENLQASGIQAFLHGAAMPSQGHVIKIVLKLFIFRPEWLIACKNSGLYGSGSPN